MKYNSEFSSYFFKNYNMALRLEEMYVKVKMCLIIPIICYID